MEVERMSFEMVPQNQYVAELFSKNNHNCMTVNLYGFAIARRFIFDMVGKLTGKIVDGELDVFERGSIKIGSDVLLSVVLENGVAKAVNRIPVVSCFYCRGAGCCGCRPWDQLTG